MLENVRVKQESSWVGLNLNFQTTIGGHRLRLELPLYAQRSMLSAVVEKAGSKIAFLRRESFPLPPLNPERLLVKDVATVMRRRWGQTSLLEISGGQEGKEPLRLHLGAGLLGDGPTQIQVSGRNMELQTSIHEGGNLEIRLPRRGKLEAVVNVK